MKYCPSCQTNYADDTLRFCLQDGTQLAEFSNQSEPTVFLTDSETIVSPKRVEPLGHIPPDVVPSQNWKQSRVTKVSSLESEPKKSNTATVVLLTAFGMFLLFGLAGIGAWLYFKNGKTEVVRNKNVVSPNLNERILDSNTNSKISPSPTVAIKTPAPNSSPPANAKPTVEPLSDFNPEQIKSEVSSKIYLWKSLSESRNLNAYMNTYADTVDYYNKKGASASFVRNDKQRAFDSFDYIKINLGNMRVSPDASGEKATAVFDKEWVFEGSEKYSAGKVQTQLQLRKISGEWRITGERDLKVYYTE
ncbi:MAG: hypothetical protein M3Q33_00820 [Acidobacteriota bacterium]|nr:hypothetical protein [Acidobacteriota bacterium]